MGIRRLLSAVLLCALYMATEASARSDNNPFEKGIHIDIDSDAGWVVRDKSATLSGSDQGNYYHLMYDRKQLRLRITESELDSDETARSYKQFAINDVRVDGERLPVFQWCLNNQQKHSRFLQQGLSVSNDVCINQGAAGTFVMRLNKATLDVLQSGKSLTFDIKPFRTSMEVSFDISGFADMSAQLAAPVVKPVAKPAPAPVPVVVEAPPRPKPKPVKKCKAEAPADYSNIKAIEYVCDDAVARSMAESSITALVKKENERRARAAAERERERQAAEAARKKEAEARKAAEAAVAAEQAAIAASLAQQEALSNEIANKMIGVCKKKWARGEHRCYCEKYIEHAPPGIKSDPACGG